MQVLNIHMKLHVLSLSWRPFWYLVFVCFVGFNWILGTFDLSDYNRLNTLQLCIHIKLTYVGDLYGF